jgi:hypothetical protein
MGAACPTHLIFIDLTETSVVIKQIQAFSERWSTCLQTEMLFSIAAPGPSGHAVWGVGLDRLVAENVSSNPA